MVQIPEVRRITSRSDSFPSIGHSSSGDDSNDNSDEEAPMRSNLVEENERLRQEMELLKVKVAYLQDKLKERGTTQKHPVVLELPELLTKRQAKDQQVELKTDYNLHESPGSGLHHRGGVHTTLQLPKVRSTSIICGSSPRTRKTDHMSDSLSTDDGSMVDDDDDDNLESQRLLGPSTSHDEGDVDVVGADEYSDNEDFFRLVSDRAGWLVGLLVLQSMSSFILARNEAMLQQHIVIIRFLTMLVGAGGNAGNQASVRVIRGLAIGTINDSNTRKVLKRECFMGLCLSLVLGISGCIRAAVFLTPMLETIAITSSLFIIVMISIVLGALLPLGMKLIGIDPAHSSTTIQVIMDILGVTITVHVSSLVLDSGFRNWLFSSSSMMGA